MVHRSRSQSVISTYMPNFFHDNENLQSVLDIYLNISHINFVHIRPFFTIHFNWNKFVIEDLRDLFTLKRFSFHHMAPVTGGIANCIRSKKIKVNIIGILLLQLLPLVSLLSYTFLTHMTSKTMIQLLKNSLKIIFSQHVISTGN